MIRHAFARWIDRVFAGEVSPSGYAVLRIGMATLFLIRHSNWLSPWLFLEHHRWVKGLDGAWSAREAPFLVSPLVPGLALGETATGWLVTARTALALLLLLGVRARASALLLAVTSYLLFASDRYRYFHHLHLFYVSMAWLALAPLGDAWSLERAIRRAVTGLAPVRASPFWPLQLLRGFVVGVYLSAGLGKLDPVWWRGETIELLYRFHLIRGRSAELLHALLGYGGLAKLVCVTELALPILLAVRRTRRVALAFGLLFHALISTSMSVSTFGAQMALLLLAFWPERRGTGPNPLSEAHKVEPATASGRVS